MIERHFVQEFRKSRIMRDVIKHYQFNKENPEVHCVQWLIRQWKEHMAESRQDKNRKDANARVQAEAHVTGATKETSKRKGQGCLRFCQRQRKRKPKGKSKGKGKYKGKGKGDWKGKSKGKGDKGKGKGKGKRDKGKGKDAGGTKGFQNFKG